MLPMIQMQAQLGFYENHYEVFYDRVKYFQIKKLANPCNEIQKIKHHFEGHICSLISLVRKFVE